jgi:hypothetical protein
VGSGSGWAGIDDGTTVRFNTFIDNDEGFAVGVTDPNEHTRSDLLLEHNTVVGPRRAYSHAGVYGSDGDVVLRRNVLVLDAAPGAGGEEPHFTWVWPWEDAPASGFLVSDMNCWYGPADGTGFRFGPETVGFADWQGRGFDPSSVFSDPAFITDTYALSTTSGCFAASDRMGAWE